MVVSNQQPTSFTISFILPRGNPAIDFFTIRVGNELKQDTCKLDKKDKKHWCDFESLVPDTEYPVHIRCCLADSGGCNVPLEGTARTMSMFFGKKNNSLHSHK